jgi:hypothetical protein
MYNLHPDLAALVARDHFEDLRRAAGEARLRRGVLRQRRQRQRRRT